MGDGRGRIGGLEVEVVGDRVTLLGTRILAGSVTGLDQAVRALVASGVSLPAAIAAASRNPLAMLRVTDRGRLAVGQRADLVELDSQLRVQRVMRAGTWYAGASV
jgi:N-acetylglucosamine-6-phosphate deacetylase